MWRHRATACVLAVLATGAAAPAQARDPSGLEMIPATIGRIFLDVHCGATPGPFPIECPPVAHVKVNLAAGTCGAEDFEVRVRQRENVQLLGIYKRKASPCAFGAHVESWPPRLPSIELATGDLLPGKPIRLVNPLPVIEVPRP